MQRAVEKYDVNVVGLTLSSNQCGFAQELLDGLDTERSRRVLLRGWEQFDEPVDRIVSIEAIEAFPQERYAPFFKTCSSIAAHRRTHGVAGDPRPPAEALAGDGHPDRDDRSAVHAVHRQGDLPRRLGARATTTSSNLSADAGFTLDGQAAARRALRAHARHCGPTALEAHHDEAVAATSEEVYQRYMKYLIGCSDFFKRGISELGQFTLVKA